MDSYTWLRPNLRKDIQEQIFNLLSEIIKRYMQHPPHTLPADSL